MSHDSVMCRIIGGLAAGAKAGWLALGAGGTQIFALCEILTKLSKDGTHGLLNMSHGVMSKGQCLNKSYES